MPKDVGGLPSDDGEDPGENSEREHHGKADEEFATVVFDEDFVRGAQVHEPSAVERLSAAAEARARRSASEGHSEDGAGQVLGSRVPPELDDFDDPDHPDGSDTDDDPYPRHSEFHGGALRWYRPVAWVLALVMGVGTVALAVGAVYRAAATSTQEPGFSSPGDTGRTPGGGPAWTGPPDEAP